MEDDKSLGFVIKDNLEANDFQVELVTDGAKGHQEGVSGNYDLIILDVMLPERDGFDVAESIRRTDRSTPILFLSAKSMVEDRIEGLKKGGDDYLTKPFSMEELILKINVFLKRSSPSPKKDSYEIGKYLFKPSDLCLELNGEVNKLTAKESQLLEMLCSSRDTVLKREEILRAVWGSDDYFLGRSMDVFISKLRKYLKDDPTITISNYHGVGFKLEVQDH